MEALDNFLQYEKDVVIISPDAGATKTISKIVDEVKSFFYDKEKYNIVDIVQCSKHKDKEGKPFVTVLNGELCEDRPCFVIDDICDGGNTFISLQK
mgnify:CR=1 FL=1